MLVFAGCSPVATARTTPVHSAAASGEPPAGAAALTPAQRAALHAGQIVEHPVSFQHHGRSYVGGVSYLLVRASPERVFSLLNRLPTLTDVLPRTRRSELIDRQGQRVRVELEQGSGVASTTYTVVFERDTQALQRGEHMVRFWLDPSRPHGIADVWGFFRATRFDERSSLVTVGALVDLGPGLLKMLFEGRVQRAILRLPHRIRDALLHAPSGGGAQIASDAARSDTHTDATTSTSERAP